MRVHIPHVTRNFLILLAGYTWLAVGLLLVYRGCFWMASAPGISWPLHAGGGILAGLLIHHFGFLKIVNRNLTRISTLGKTAPVTSFIPAKSYLTIAVMVTAGILLRHSSIPKHHLAALYCAIGSALILSSIRYLRVCIMRFSSKQHLKD